MKAFITKQDLFQILSRKILKDKILIDKVNLISYSYDASFYTLKPRAIVRPSTIEEIQYILSIANQYLIPITFRAAGTSLSGQAIGNGIIVDIGFSEYWKKYTILENGKKIRFEPGIIGSDLNQFLKPYKRKIGPDPASINACMMGGILANNASGMCCGVKNNSYNTLSNIKAILYDGYVFDTFNTNCEEDLKKNKNEIYQEILNIKNYIHNNKNLYKLIENKYKIKNTIGYSLNAFIDFDKVSDIIAHLLIGSEGTLGFIAEAELLTIPDYPYKLTGLLCFGNIFDACDSIPLLVELNASAVELMDRSSIRSIEKKPNIPEYLKTLPEEATCLLVEFEFQNKQEKNLFSRTFYDKIKKLKIIHNPDFSDEENKRNNLWKIRKGLFPSVGSIRDKNTTVIIEDIAFPLKELPYATIELQKLFKKHGYHNAIIFGHAKDGNLHFVITQAFDTQNQIHQYDVFIKDVVDLVTKKFNGSLKAEHGTGRNMAPFVEKEWGTELYEIMKKIKKLFDPNTILNPDVIINENPNAHILNLKKIPSFTNNIKKDFNNYVFENTEKCIECGFCETVCPSKLITSTPRKRIILKRELERNLEAFEKNYNEFLYYFSDTCVKCGLCEIPCPVQINVGNFVKEILNENHNDNSNKIALWTVRNFALIEKLLRFQLSIVYYLSQFNFINLEKITIYLNKYLKTPVYYTKMGKPSSFKNIRKNLTLKDNVDYYYFPTCLSRVIGGTNNIQLHQLIPEIAEKLNIPLQIIDSTGFCCAQPYESKGYFTAQKEMKQKTYNLFHTLKPDIPIIIDNTSCSYAFKKNEIYKKFTIFDSIEWIQILMERFPDKFKNINKKIYIQNICSLQKLNLNTMLFQLLENVSKECYLSNQIECCGFAGDKGIFYPEVTKSTTKIIKDRISSNGYDEYISCNLTCDIGLSAGTERNFKHFLYIIYESLL